MLILATRRDGLAVSVATVGDAAIPYARLSR